MRGECKFIGLMGCLPGHFLTVLFVIRYSWFVIWEGGGLWPLFIFVLRPSNGLKMVYLYFEIHIQHLTAYHSYALSICLQRELSLKGPDGGVRAGMSDTLLTINPYVQLQGRNG